MRSMWKGSISFGLVNVPIKLYTATESKGISFRQLHRECLNPIKYEKKCPVCEENVAADEIVRGYEYEKGRYVIINDEDLEKIPEETTRAIDIIDFVDIEEIDPIFFDRSYFLAPDETGTKAYALLRKTMEDTGKIAIAKIVIRSKQNLACIRVYKEKHLVMETMYYPDEIRDVNEIPLVKEPKLTEAEIKMANQLVNSLSEEFKPEKYTDEYREALLDIIEAKVEGEEIKVPDRREPGKVVDLMEALKASLEAAEKDRKDKREQAKKEAEPKTKKRKEKTG